VTQLDALMATIAIEVAVGLPLLLATRWVERKDWWRAALALIAASLLTHPFAWKANVERLQAWPFEQRALVIELAVAAVETAVLAFGLRLSLLHAVVTAAPMNAVSFMLGLWLARWW
jgi:hypothetical protein